ncbi:TRAP transporter substrate-binding protein [Tranquillimonas alkanivorans]|uniref:TRAP-type C4-dicarboxylate transport system, substrate-binding protein n=1 Tax=Tranquillimonas alkanivorans TaxID=441119 RepID=A0A1I5TMG4_9RHOB|nr:TRAP transporter substrate-binding protein [Tranquillimonas alkanivorans]SFP83807.1 TRAP-type C4-dicarboxylate transport system, substrate-binding protein [Tranquillimonas alkanivorans]
MLNRTILAACLIVPAASVHAQEFRWDLSTEYGPNSINTRTNQFFAERVSELTDGEVDITIHPGAALGYREKDHLFAVSDGAVPIATTVSGTLAGVDPIFLLSSLPFLAEDFEDVRSLLEIARPHYEDVFSQYGQQLIYAGWVDPSGVWAQDVMESTEDFEDLPIRTYDATGTRVLQELGAAPVQISWSDVVPQLATGSIEAVLTGVDGGAASGFWDYTDAFTQINYAMPLTFVHVNQDSYDALPEEYQQALMQAGQEAREWQAEQVVANQSAKYDELRDHGMTVAESVSPEFARSLSEAAQPIIDEWKERVGDRAGEILNEFNATE